MSNFQVITINFMYNRLDTFSLFLNPDHTLQVAHCTYDLDNVI